jgi:hypothetical protein
MPNPHLIRDHEAAMAAVKWNGYALQHVRDQTEAICRAAVKQDGYALQYVRDDNLYDKIVGATRA